MKPNCASCRLRFLIFTILTAAIVVNGLHAAEAQFLGQDTVRFLEQSTFGPTYDLIAHVQDIGFEAFLNEQAAAPMSHYPELPFWPQTRPTTCTNDAPSTCQRDNYTLYLLQQHFFSNALYGQDQLRQRVAFALGQILVTSAVDVPLPSWMRGYSMQNCAKLGSGLARQMA